MSSSIFEGIAIEGLSHRSDLFSPIAVEFGLRKRGSDDVHISKLCSRRNSTRGERIDRSSSGERPHAHEATESSRSSGIEHHLFRDLQRQPIYHGLCPSVAQSPPLFRVRREFLFGQPALCPYVDPRRRTFCAAERGCRSRSRSRDGVSRITLRVITSIRSGPTQRQKTGN